MIELKGVSFSYGKDESSVGLKNINLKILDGEVLLLCGESGCGKTTLIRLINGLIPHFYEGNLSGQVIVNGKDVSMTPLYETAGVVGSVFQNPRSQFFNVDTTGEIAFGCENMGLAEEEIHSRVKSTVNELNMAHLMGRSIFALSGGEKQKIACASVCALSPDIFVLDEPSSNLDVSATVELRRLIELWKKQGKTVIISEHRLYYLRDLANRVLYMANGQIANEFTWPDFSSLEGNGFSRMGLRALSFRNLDIGNNPLPNTTDKEIVLCNFRFAYKGCGEVLNIGKVSIPIGEIVALIGHNGAGKSTFARCLCGLEKKCFGVLEKDGEKLNSKQRLKSCYMVMQDVNHQLFTESVLEEVLLSMEEPDEFRAEQILESLDLLVFKDLHPMALSGGQKQRVAISSAVASEREIIVFDEPTSGLDLRHMYEVAQNIHKLSALGKTLFIVTHDPELILACCTYVLHIEGGVVQEEYPLCRENLGHMLSFFDKLDSVTV